MEFDDMSDEEKKLMLGRVQSEQSPEQGMDSITPIKVDNDHYNSQKEPSPAFGSLGYKEEPSYASQNVPQDVSQPLNDNESNIDSQQAAKQAALEKLIAQAGTLTPMNQKIAEGMGGMGSVNNVASKTLIPLAERASASFLQKAGPEAKTFASRPEEYAHYEDAAKKARDSAMALWEEAPHSFKAIKANNLALAAEKQFDRFKNMFNSQK